MACKNHDLDRLVWMGCERQFCQHTAGLRTSALLAIASGVFVDLVFRLDGPTGATNVAAYVVTGVGFLGAGTIMKGGLNAYGLNTAETLLLPVVDSIDLEPFD